MEVIPRDNSPDVHEPPKVEENVDTGIDFVMTGFSLRQIAAVPVQGTASKETGEEVVRSDAATGSKEEQLMGLAVSMGYIHSRDLLPTQPGTARSFRRLSTS